MRTPVIILALGAVAVFLPPVLPSGYFVNVLIVICIYILLASSLDIVVGWTGKYSFAQAAFFGIGAYTAAILEREFGTGILVHLPAGLCVAALFGLLLGLPSFRLHGHFLAIMTIAFQTVVYLTLAQWTGFTGGQYGLSVSPVSWAAALPEFYRLALLITVVVLLFVFFLTRSRFGDSLRAVRDDEELARTIGIDSRAIKLAAFVLSAGIAGIAGVLMAHHVRGVTPNDYTILISATIMAMVLVGGKGRFWGPLLGATLLTVLPELMGDLEEYRHMIYGALLTFVIIVMPEGIAGLVARRRSA
ncbi:branched-chain amino acid ABC transporter permease [Sulfitobacter sp.]|uniref:branched-chain amino acid ABC transporter permease n=1 Tax=Sulfitobacter sp. TaxID=1903071 RepID=UPI00329A35AF